MKSFAFASAETGLFTGATFSGPEGRIEENTPPGIIAWPYEDVPPDPRLQRLQDGVLVARLLPALAAPEFDRRKTEMGNLALFEIQQAEISQARPLREILSAQLAGVPASQSDVDVFTALKSGIDAARARYRQIMLASSDHDLDAVET
jgi:hypothetical protein